MSPAFFLPAPMQKKDRSPREMPADHEGLGCAGAMTDDLILYTALSIQDSDVWPHPGRLNALHIKLTCNIPKEEYNEDRYN